MDTGPCPFDVESLAEEYCLGRLDQAAADQLLMHCATCKYCGSLCLTYPAKS
jgi:hypothetical protein